MMLTKHLYSCHHCKQDSVTKYHNTFYVYCDNCHQDKEGETVYLCGICGITEVSNRMETEVICSSCWQKEVAA